MISSPTRHPVRAFGVVVKARVKTSSESPSVSSAPRMFATKVVPVLSSDCNGRRASNALGAPSIARARLRAAFVEAMCLAMCDHPGIPQLDSVAVNNAIIYVTLPNAHAESDCATTHAR